MLITTKPLSHDVSLQVHAEGDGGGLRFCLEIGGLDPTDVTRSVEKKYVDVPVEQITALIAVSQLGT